MVAVVRGSARAVLAMGVAAAVSIASGGVASAAAGAVSTEKPAAATSVKAKPDKGPGPKGPKGAPYPKAGVAGKVKQSGPKADAKPVEVPGMRTATSRTLEDPVTGLLSTRLAAESINYQDSKGTWQPIDNVLVPAGKDAKAGKAAWKNTANRFTATFPTSLTGAGAVSVADAANPARSLSLSVLPETGAPAATTAAPVVKGDQVAYPNAAGDGADLGYAVGGDGVKESITLADAGALGADGAIAFTLTPGAGLSPTLAGDGSITVADAKGATAFTVPAPFMDDAKAAHSSDVAVTLTPTAGRAGVWTVTLTPNATWLGDAARAFPVVVDPSIEYPSPISSCSIRSAAPSTAGCGGAQLPISADTNNASERVLLRFDDLLNVVPADAVVEHAEIDLAVVGGAAGSVDVREATNDWNNNATWNTRDGSQAWGTPGGDRSSTVAGRSTLTPNGSVQAIQVGALVQGWVQGDSRHRGFVLEKTSPVAGGGRVLVGGTANSTGPGLFVEWLPRLGARKANTAVVDVDVTDRTKVSVNPATGNARITTTELSIAGAGLNLGLAHSSNSLSPDAFGVLGHGWTSSAGGAGGVRLAVHDWGITYTDGSGAQYAFHKNLSGGYDRPMGLDADLATAAGGTYTLTGRSDKVAQTFTPIGNNIAGLSSVKDRNGQQITYTYDTSATHPWSGTKILRSITDTRGRVVTINNPGYWNTSATDSANRSVTYTVTNEDLVAFTDTAGGQTQFGYDSAHRVTTITSPEGRVTTLAYDGQGRLTSLVRPTGPTWELTYSPTTRTNGAPATTTAVKDPNGNTTTYTSDGRGRVGKAVDARGKTRSATYTANDDLATSVGATQSTAGGAGATTANTYNPDTFTIATTRTPTGAGQALTYGTGARLYDVIQTSDARGNATAYGYDTTGNRTTITRGGTTTTYLYQGDTDPAYGGTVNCGPGTTPGATKTGVLCEQRDALYVAGSNASSTTAHRTAYRYDANGQLAKLIPAGTSATGSSSTGRGIQTFTYDALSRLSSVTDGKGQKSDYGYDALDRQTYVHHQDGSSESSYITGDGPLRSVAEYASSGTQTRYTAYDRDDLNQLQDVDAPEGYLDFTYDSAGRITEYTDTGGTIKYRYNAADQLTSLAEPGGDCGTQTYDNPGAASTKCTLFRVDDDGRRTGTKYPGGATQTWTLDDSGRTTRSIGTAAGDNKLDRAYTYTDANAPAGPNNPTKDTGLIQSVTDAVAGAKTSYSYDNLDRLTVGNATATGTSNTVDYEAFCYDAAGNRTKYYTAPGANCSTASPAITSTFDGANQMTAATGNGPTGQLTGSGFTYDANGNQTTAKSIPGRSTSYNDRDQAVTTTPTGGAAITSTYAGTGNADRLTAGATSFQSTPLSAAPGWSKTGNTTTWAVRDPQGALIAIRQGTTASGATSYYPFTDQVSSVRVLVTAAGAVAKTYTYSASGIVRTQSGNLNQPYQYAGGYTDVGSGLIKLGARYYEVTYGRFTQMDPSSQDSNSYLYAGGSLVISADPTGLLYVNAGITGCLIVCVGVSLSQNFKKQAPRFSVTAGAGVVAGLGANIGLSSGRAAPGDTGGVSCNVKAGPFGVYAGGNSSRFEAGYAPGIGAGCYAGATTTF